MLNILIIILRDFKFLRHNYKQRNLTLIYVRNLTHTYPARMPFFYLMLPFFDARTYDFSLCGIFVLAHEQYGIFYTSGDGSAFAPVVRPPTTSVPPHWPTQHHLATAAQ